MPLQEQIRNLVASNKLKQAIALLLDNSTQDTDLHNQVVMLSGRFQDLERKDRMGLLSPGEANVTRNQVVAGLLGMLESFEGLTPPTPNSANAPKKILFVSADPSDQTRLAVNQEYRLIKAEMERGQHRDSYEFLQPQLSVTIGELVRALNDQPEIIHFSGHGVREGLVITTENNTTQVLPVPVLQRLFRPLSGKVELVLLNSCYSASQAVEISKFNTHVVGYNLPIGDAAAIQFAQGLYNGLGAGKQLKDAFNDAMIVLMTQSPAFTSLVEVWKDGEKLAW